jgi:hypothetical protein
MLSRTENFGTMQVFSTGFFRKLLWKGVETLQEALMPIVNTLLLAATVVIVPVAAHAQTVVPPTPVTTTLSPNNCGTPDTPKPCHFAKRQAPKAVHQTSATTLPK